MQNSPLPGTQSGPLSRAKIINETKWLGYCFCEGCGLGPVSDPLIASEAKELCLRSSVTTTDIMAEDGLCNSAQICFCLTQQCHMPPLEGAPACACVNKKCGNAPAASSKWPKDGLFQQNDIMGDDTFWLYYFLCAGVGINKMDKGYYGAQFKELCCRGTTKLESPVIDGVFCSMVGTEFCIWSECQCPPAKPNPTFALCTWRLNKETFSG